MRLTLVLALLFPLQAAAGGCLVAEDLAKGIDVTLKGGVVHRYEGTPGGAVRAQAPEVIGGEGFEREYRFQEGLFVTEERLTERAKAAANVVGGNDGGTVVLIARPRGSLPKVAPGTSWTGKVKFRREEDGPSIGPQEPVTAVLAGSMRMLGERTVTLSGCSYRIVPVETRLELGKDSRLHIGAVRALGDEGLPGRAMVIRRQIHFLDLGFAVVTQESDDVAALPVFKRGIVGLARAGG